MEGIKFEEKCLLLLEWTSESDYFQRCHTIFLQIHVEAKSNYLTPCCACAERDKNQEPQEGGGGGGGGGNSISSFKTGEQHG